MKKIIIVIFSIVAIVISSTFESCKKEEKLLIIPPISSSSSVDGVEGYWERCVSAPGGLECYQTKWIDSMIYEPFIAGDTSSWGFSGQYFYFNDDTDSLFISDYPDISFADDYKVIKSDSSLWITSGKDTVRYHRL